MTDGQVIILIISATLFGMFFVAWLDELITKKLKDYIEKVLRQNQEAQKDHEEKLQECKKQCEYLIDTYRGVRRMQDKKSECPVESTFTK